MFDNNKILFSGESKIEEVKEEVAKYDKYTEDGDKDRVKQQILIIARIMKERIEERYIKPINIFLHNCTEHPEQSGFIVMSINCILIEVYFEMIMGLDASDECGYKVKDAYTTILPILDPEINNRLASIFYKEVRCKVIHQGQTGRGVAITFENLINKIITMNGEYYLCNPRILFDGLNELYKKY